jgi:hypothetical protein
MANGKTHRRIGKASGALTAIARTQTTDTPLDVLLHAVGGYCGGAVGAAMPDVIEPAVHSHHRNVAHSYTTGGAVVATTAKYLEVWEAYCRSKATAAALRRTQTGRSELQTLGSVLEELLWKLLYGFGPGVAAGYVSHLALDAGTPRGIPLLLRGF